MNNQATGLDMFVENTVASYTDWLFTPEVKGAIEVAVRDTNKANVEPVVDIETFEKSNNTEEAYEEVAPDLTFENALNVAESFIPEEDVALRSWFNIFTSG